MEPILYSVRPGNTLWSIAQYFGTSAENIARYNGIVYPYTIYPGQTLKIPVEQVTPPQFYSVRTGDTLWTIAQRFGLTVPQLLSYNNLNNPNIIYPNQVLKLTP